MKTVTFALLGAATGTLSGLSILIPLGQVPSIELFGLCIGNRLFGECTGFNLSFLLFPGLIYGLCLGAVLSRLGMLPPQRVIAFAVGAALSNAVAFAAALAVFDLVTALFGDATIMSIQLAAGVVAGAIGGGLLAGIAGPLPFAGRPGVAAVAAALGLLLPIWPSGVLGSCLFYAVWQAGVADALAATLRHKEGLDDRAVII